MRKVIGFIFVSCLILTGQESLARGGEKSSTRPTSDIASRMNFMKSLLNDLDQLVKSSKHKETIKIFNWFKRTARFSKIGYHHGRPTVFLATKSNQLLKNSSVGYVYVTKEDFKMYPRHPAILGFKGHAFYHSGVSCLFLRKERGVAKIKNSLTLLHEIYHAYRYGTGKVKSSGKSSRLSRLKEEVIVWNKYRFFLESLWGSKYTSIISKAREDVLRDYRIIQSRKVSSQYPPPVDFVLTIITLFKFHRHHFRSMIPRRFEIAKLLKTTVPKEPNRIWSDYLHFFLTYVFFSIFETEPMLNDPKKIITIVNGIRVDANYGKLNLFLAYYP